MQSLENTQSLRPILFLLQSIRREANHVILMVSDLREREKRMEVNMFRKFRPILVTAVILALLLAPGLVSTAQASSSPTHWAIVLSGGANYYNNHARYWNDLSEMYEILTDTYGYDEDNVFVLYADGNPPEADPDVDTGDIVWPTPGDPG
jgi:hypothetical protein